MSNIEQEEASEWAKSEFTDMLADCPRTAREMKMMQHRHYYIPAMAKAYLKGAESHAAKSGDGFQKGFESRQPEVDKLKGVIDSAMRQLVAVINSDEVSQDWSIRTQLTNIIDSARNQMIS